MGGIGILAQKVLDTDWDNSYLMPIVNAERPMRS